MKEWTVFLLQSLNDLKPVHWTVKACCHAQLSIQASFTRQRFRWRTIPWLPSSRSNWCHWIRKLRCSKSKLCLLLNCCSDSVDDSNRDKCILFERSEAVYESRKEREVILHTAYCMMSRPMLYIGGKHGLRRLPLLILDTGVCSPPEGQILEGLRGAFVW